MKIVRGVSQVLKNSETTETIKPPKSKEKNKLSIDSKDIIEAEFEEVHTNKQTK
jgi:hypothetical protein